VHLKWFKNQLKFPRVLNDFKLDPAAEQESRNLAVIITHNFVKTNACAWKNPVSILRKISLEKALVQLFPTPSNSQKGQN